MGQGAPGIETSGQARGRATEHENVGTNADVPA